MKQYEKFKDSGIEWLGDIPAHWKIIRIKDHTYVKARIGWQGLRSDEFVEDTNWYCITGTDFYNGIINWENCYCVSEDRYEQDKKIQLKVDDLLITKDGSIGKIAIVKSLPKKSTLNSGVFVTRPKHKEYYNSFMFWLLSSNIFIDFIDITKNGSTVLHLYQNVFERFHFCVPSTLEQVSISNYLDSKTQVIDKKIDLLTKKIYSYQELRKSLINETVCRGLNKNVKLKDSGIDWIGKIPEYWKIDRAANHCNQNKKYNKNLEEQNLLSLSYGRIIRKDIDTNMGLLPESFSGYQIVETGYIILRLTDLQNDKNSLRVGYCSEKGIITSAYLGLIFNEKLINTKFMYYLLHNYDLKKVFYSQGGSMRQSMKFDDFKLIPIIIPDTIEQITIANYLDEKTQVIDNIVSNIRQQIDTLKKLRKTLINEVVTGKIKVTE